MGLRLKYFAGEAVVNLKRNLFMTIAAVSTVAVSLFLLGGVIVFGHIIGNVVGQFNGKVEINVFLQDSITPAQLQQLRSTIDAMPDVSGDAYVSKAEAFKQYQKMFAGDNQITANVDPNALPASLQIKLHNPNQVDAVKSQIVGLAGVDKVNYGGDAVKQLLRINTLLRTISLVMTILLLTAATVLIANTIRLAIYSRRREISVMKLVGATNWFIRVPFIFEGVVEAVAGACVAGGVIWVAKLLWLDRLQSTMLFLPIGITSGTVLGMFVVLVVVGMSVGTLGSTMALRRFLEV